MLLCANQFLNRLNLIVAIRPTKTGKKEKARSLQHFHDFLRFCYGFSFLSRQKNETTNHCRLQPQQKFHFFIFTLQAVVFFFLPFVSFVLLKNYIQNKNSCRKFFLSRVTHAGDSVRSSLLGFLVNSLIASNYRQQPRERVNEITSRMFHYFTLKRV